MPSTNNNNAANVTAGKPKVTGAIYVAPIGSTAPTDATTDLAAAFKCLGYISEDGLTHAVSRESEEIKEWGGKTIMTSQTEYAEKFTFTTIEMLNADVLKAIFGASNVSETTGLRTTATDGSELPASMWVFDMMMSNNKARRIFVPNGRVSSVGEIGYKNNEPVGAEVEVTAFPDGSAKFSYTFDELPTT